MGSLPFVVQDGQTFINKSFVESLTVDYPVLLASGNGSFALFKDGHVELRDHTGTLRVKTFTTKSI